MTRFLYGFGGGDYDGDGEGGGDRLRYVDFLDRQTEYGCGSVGDDDGDGIIEFMPDKAIGLVCACNPSGENCFLDDMDEYTWRLAQKAALPCEYADDDVDDSYDYCACTSCEARELLR